MATFPQTTLGLMAEVDLAGTWTDASTLVYQRAAVQISRGRQNESAQISPSQATLMLNNRDGRWSIRNPLGTWFGQLVQSTPLRLSVPSSLTGINCYLRLEADQASYASTPDSTALQITSGTLSVRIDCKITDNRQCSLIGKWGSTAKAWDLFLGSSNSNSDYGGDGLLTLYTYDGTSQHEITATLPLPYFNNRIALRADYNISSKTVTFYTAATMSGSWTQLGTVVTTTATALSAGTGQAVQVGTTNFAGMYGEVYEAQILSTSTLEADPVFTSQTPGATSFTDAQSNTWTLAGTAQLSGRSYRFHGELASLPKAADPSAKDVYSAATASGITRRMQQQQTPAASAMTRAYLRLPGNLQLAGYWPCEDGVGSGQLASAYTGGIAGNATPQVELANSTTFACSSAIPVLNGGTMSFTVNAPGVTWTDNVIRFLWALPSGDDTNGTAVAIIYTTGTCSRIELIYTTGGNLQLQGYNATGGTVFSSSTTTFGLTELEECRVSVELTSESGNNFQCWILTPAGTATVLGGSTTWTGTIGAVTAVDLGNGLVGSAMGQVSVQGKSDGINDLSQPLNAWLGETAGSRVARLCTEEGIACRIIGPPDESQPMGYQTQETISSLLQECETTDEGMLFEPRQVLGLGYITCQALYQQPVTTTANYSLAQLGAKFSPASDDQLLVNDVTMTAADGTSSRQVLSSGVMSVLSPEQGWAPASGSATSPAAAAVLAQTGTIAAGTYTAYWVVTLSGTLASRDANNFQLLAAGTVVATSVNTDTAGTFVQTPVTFTTTTAGTLEVQAVAAGTSGAVYSAVIPGLWPGAGRFDTSVTVNPEFDSTLADLANWYLHVRTVNDDRYPVIPFDMARTETPATVPLLDIGSYLQLTTTPQWVPPGPVKQLAAGFRETLGPFAIWTIDVNGIPETPYETGIVNDPVYGHADTDGSCVHTSLSSSGTSMLVDTISPAYPLWTTSAGDFPFNVTLNFGEEVTVTGITGTTSPQTFTITRGVNGVQVAHNPGEDVRLTFPMIVSL